jgi:hypothetical protein
MWIHYCDWWNRCAHGVGRSEISRYNRCKGREDFRGHFYSLQQKHRYERQFAFTNSAVSNVWHFGSSLCLTLSTRIILHRHLLITWISFIYFVFNVNFGVAIVKDCSRPDTKKNWQDQIVYLIMNRMQKLSEI